MFPNETGKLLIDTLLCSGMNEYRFIETTLNEDGTINLDNYGYVSVNDEVLKKLISEPTAYIVHGKK